MKKIQKVNSLAAQSVYSFYCPCSGYCSSICACTTPNNRQTGIELSMTQNNPHAGTTV